MAQEDNVHRQPQQDSSPIRILLVDDHPVVRRGLAACLAAFDDLRLAGEASDGEQAVQSCAQLQPDVVLMDLSMPGMNGIEATRRIVEHWPSIRVIALTSFVDETLVQEACEAGVTGYLLKNVSGDDLAAAVRDAVAGRATLAPDAAQALVRRVAAPTLATEPLTNREREVLALMVEGLSNEKIAARLMLSRATIKFHIGRIFCKLHAASRTEAVAIALQQHLLP